MAPKYKLTVLMAWTLVLRSIWSDGGRWGMVIKKKCRQVFNSSDDLRFH